MSPELLLARLIGGSTGYKDDVDGSDSRFEVRADMSFSADEGCERIRFSAVVGGEWRTDFFLIGFETGTSLVSASSWLAFFFEAG